MLRQSRNRQYDPVGDRNISNNIMKLLCWLEISKETSYMQTIRYYRLLILMGIAISVATAQKTTDISGTVIVTEIPAPTA